MTFTKLVHFKLCFASWANEPFVFVVFGAWPTRILWLLDATLNDNAYAISIIRHQYQLSIAKARYRDVIHIESIIATDRCGGTAAVACALRSLGRHAVAGQISVCQYEDSSTAPTRSILAARVVASCADLNLLCVAL